MRGCTEAQLEQSIREADPTLVHDVCQAVSVGETYFFRTPEQFDFIAARVWPRLAHEARLRSWSAGCATGEETYSLAAFLLALMRDGDRKLEVVGTDLVSRNIEVARQGRYGRWSVRHAQQLVPAFHELPDKRIEVDDRLRRTVSFAEHNLLLPLPASFGTFHLIFCRNVLVYFARETAARALVYLATALAPGGVLVFGSMDVPEVPPGFQRVGPTELQIYERAAPRSESHVAESQDRPPRATGSTARPRRRRARRHRHGAPGARAHDAGPPARGAGARPLAPHRGSSVTGPPGPHQALALRRPSRSRCTFGPWRSSRPTTPTGPTSCSTTSSAASPITCRPGWSGRCCTCGSANARSGQRLMREVLDGCRDRPLDEVLAAPAPMTVAFVLASAQASLGGGRNDRLAQGPRGGAPHRPGARSSWPNARTPSATSPLRPRATRPCSGWRSFRWETSTTPSRWRRCEPPCRSRA